MNERSNRDRLLTISEAAEYLSVSKATIRRWTNTGRLSCVRLGARGERRFKLSALDQLMSGVDNPQFTIQSIHSPKKESAQHRCFMSDDPEQEWTILGIEVASALREGKHVFLVDDAKRHKLLRRHLRENGFELNRLEAQGTLTRVSIEESYLLNGEMQWERAVAYFESVILAAKARGVDELLIIGNSSWLGDYSKDATLLRELSLYERGMDEVIKRYPGASIVCPFTAHQVDSQILVEALACHEAIGVRPAVVSM